MCSIDADEPTEGRSNHIILALKRVSAVIRSHGINSTLIWCRAGSPTSDNAGFVGAVRLPRYSMFINVHQCSSMFIIPPKYQLVLYVESVGRSNGERRFSFKTVRHGPGPCKLLSNTKTSTEILSVHRTESTRLQVLHLPEPGTSLIARYPEVYGVGIQVFPKLKAVPIPDY